MQTTERYLGCKQNLGHPVNDVFLFALRTVVASSPETSVGSASLDRCKAVGGLLNEDELREPREDKLKSIRSYAKVLTKVDAAA